MDKEIKRRKYLREMNRTEIEKSVNLQFPVGPSGGIYIIKEMSKVE